jgi:hypothetical protein
MKATDEMGLFCGISYGGVARNVWANPGREKRNSHGNSVDEAAVTEKDYAQEENWKLSLRNRYTTYLQVISWHSPVFYCRVSPSIETVVVESRVRRARAWSCFPVVGAQWSRREGLSAVVIGE